MDAHLEALPVLRQWVEEISTVLGQEESGSLSACQPAFERLVRSSLIQELLHFELGRLLESEAYAPAEATETHWTIIRRPLFSLALSFHERPPPTEPEWLQDLLEDRLVGVVGPGPLRFELLHQPVPHPRDVLDRSRRLVEVERARLAPGEVRLLRAGEHVPLLHSAGSPTFLLTLSSTQRLDIRWEYDRATLQPVRMMAANSQTSRLESTIWLLLMLGEPQSVPTLTGLTKHPNNQVRWAALRALIRLDPQEGLRLLNQYAEDPHPYIRNAVRRSLEKRKAPGPTAT
jgi:hypothetical protein